MEKLRDEDREVERERASLVARAEALELGLARKDGTGALLAASERISGLLGSVAAVVDVERGYEHAVAAALGTAADAVAVSSLDDAVAALGLLKSDDAGRAGLLIGSDPRSEVARRGVAAVAARSAVGARPRARAGRSCDSRWQRSRIGLRFLTTSVPR